MQSVGVGVICKKCAAPVRTEAAERVPEQFSVSCKACGYRGFYKIKDIKTLDQA